MIVTTTEKVTRIIVNNRYCDGKHELSVLDFFIVCSSVLPFVTKMVLDEAKDFILTNYKQGRRSGKAVDTDHNTQYMDVDIEIEVNKPERVEIYDFKDNVTQMKFKQLTTETQEFTRCFENSLPVSKQVDLWQEVLETYFKKSFKKIRIKKRNIKPLKAPLKSLINERNKLSKLKKHDEN